MKILKGKSRPYNKLRKRIKNLKKIKSIDKVVSFNKKTPLNLIRKIKPDIIVKGGDYLENKVVGNKLSDVFIFPYIEGYSSTNMINKLKK